MADSFPAEIRHLDVCSGLGMFSLGLVLADSRIRTVGFVERQSYCASVLLDRMEDEALARAPVWCGELEDISGSDRRALRGKVDLFTAGYPCPPYSGAGKGLKDDDERAIWPEVFRLVSSVEPSCVLLENVRPSAFRGPYSDLRRMGYELGPRRGPLRVAAEDVGAPHRRARYFLVAYTAGFFERLREQRVAGGSPGRVRDEGNAVARQPRTRVAKGKGGRTVGDADGRRRKGKRVEEHRGVEGALGDVASGHGDHWLEQWPPERGDERWRGYPACAQPGFPGTVDGPAARVEQLHALGNGLLPQVAAATWRWFLRNAGRV